MRRAYGLIAGCMVLAGCGGGTSPTAPDPATANGPPAGAVLTFRSGETDQPAAGAQVSLGTETYTTDGRGEIRLRSGAAVNTTLTVDAGGFLKRETRVRGMQDTLFTLWPSTNAAGLSENYTHQLVYPGGSPLHRLPLGARRVSIVPSAAILDDTERLEAHRYAAERMTEATSGQVVYTVDAAFSGGVLIQSDLTPDPASACGGASTVACAHTNWGPSYELETAWILLGDDLRGIVLRAVILHELGHTYGLNHTYEGTPRDVMEADSPTLNTQNFSPRELISMRLMLQRLGGNAFPDSDVKMRSTTSTTATLGSSGRSVVVCVLDRSGRFRDAPHP